MQRHFSDRSIDKVSIVFSSTTVICLLALSFPALTEEMPVGISCQFEDVTEYEGEATGRIIVDVFNLSTSELRNVLVRIDASINGGIQGDNHHAVHLDPGGGHAMTGIFTLPSAILAEEMPLVWEVRYQDSGDHVIRITSDVCSF